MKKLFTALMLIVAFKVTATEVIVISYPGKIFLGVDSRISYVDKTGKRFSVSGCKIFEANGIVYAFAGYAGTYGNYSTSSKNFNTELYIKSILNRRDKPVLQMLEDLKKGLAEE